MPGPRVYPYRWVVLGAYALITVIIQLQWLTFAPVAREARVVYHASALQIDLLSMIFMGVFLVACIPASQVLDRYGLRVGVGIGAALTGVFGLLKGLGASSYVVVTVAQVGLAVAQPFIINAVTKVAVQWFPINERATAVGLATLAQFVGVIVAMMATPPLVTRVGAGYDLHRMLMIYAAVSVAGAVLLLALLRERPPTPPGSEAPAGLLTRAALRHIFSQRDTRLIVALFFVGLGLFNAVSTCIDQVCEKKGLTSAQGGLVGGVMLIAGIVGAAVLPPFSDRLRRRKPFLIGAMVLALPGLVGLTVAHGYVALLVSAGVLGFFLLGAGAPIGFQYAAEVSYPAPESLSQGVILFAGQVSGILFIVGMNGLGMIRFLWVLCALALVNVVFALLMRESPRILTAPK